jgi:hypothetical protein
MRKRLGEILVEKKIITEEQLRQCLDEQRTTKEFLGNIFIKRKLLREEDLMRALSEQFCLPCMDLKISYVDWKLCLRFSVFAKEGQNAFPISDEEDAVVVAVSDPLDANSINSIEERVRPKKLKLVLVTQSALKELLVECHKRSRSSLMNLLDEKEKDV